MRCSGRCVEERTVWDVLEINLINPLAVGLIFLGVSIFCIFIFKNICFQEAPPKYLKRTNFRVYLFSRAKKNRISRVLIFANDKLLKILRV